MTVISRGRAARLPGLHERQEQLEAENLLAAGLGRSFGVATRSWPDGLWSVRTERAPNHAPGIAHELEAWMASPLDGLSVEAPPHDIRLVETEAALEGWLKAFIRGWGIEKPELQRMVRGTMAPWPGPKEWRRYVALVDGEPAGEALLALFGDVAYLAEASTAPDYRKRGIQRALIARRVADAREAGASVVFGAVQYGDPSWANMRAMGLREEHLTLSFKRAA